MRPSRRARRRQVARRRRALAPGRRTVRRRRPHQRSTAAPPAASAAGAWSPRSAVRGGRPSEPLVPPAASKEDIAQQGRQHGAALLAGPSRCRHRRRSGSGTRRTAAARWSPSQTPQRNVSSASMSMEGRGGATGGSSTGGGGGVSSTSGGGGGGGGGATTSARTTETGGVMAAARQPAVAPGSGAVPGPRSTPASP